MHTGHHDVELTVRSILDKSSRQASLAGTCNDATVAQAGADTDDVMALDAQHASDLHHDFDTDMAIPNLQQLDLEPARTDLHSVSERSDPTPKLGGGTTLTAGTVTNGGAALASPSVATIKKAHTGEAAGVPLPAQCWRTSQCKHAFSGILTHGANIVTVG